MAGPVRGPVVRRAAGAQNEATETTASAGHLLVDLSTAKTLVSALLVSAIVLFSVYSVRMLIIEIARDLKAGRAQRTVATEGSRAD